MHTPKDLKAIEGMDIYLIDQVMKGVYKPGTQILDAGAGGGRNLTWFFSNDFNITACDIDAGREEIIQARNKEASFNWETCDLAKLPFEDGQFDHVICNAVLHFARDEEHFETMISELTRVLKRGGTLFIRTCTDIGMEEKTKPVGNGQFKLPDGSVRFLLTRQHISDLIGKMGYQQLEAVKTVNVEDLRAMCTLMLVKYDKMEAV